jgi:hypothetical protein
MMTFNKRKIVDVKLQGVILSNRIKELNVKSRNIGKVIINKCDDKYAEVSEIDSDGNAWRHAVKLERQECTCRE